MAILPPQITVHSFLDTLTGFFQDIHWVMLYKSLDRLTLGFDNEQHASVAAAALLKYKHVPCDFAQCGPVWVVFQTGPLQTSA